MMLETRNLTMRFGGLTAVSAVDLRVDKGQIYSIIGPNGAGKTTLFNAVTGIYEPTEGTVTFEGHSLRRAFSWRTLLTCVVVGSLTGMLACLLALNFNKLWRAAVYRPSVGTSEKFSYPRLGEGVRAYLFNDLVVERIPRSTRFRVVSADHKDDDRLAVVLAEASTEAEAKAIRDRLYDLQIQPGDPVAAPAQEGKSWVVLDRVGGTVYFVAESQADAETIAVGLAKMEVIGDQRPRRAIYALIIGFFIGSAGTLTVWNRSRRTADGIALGGIARTFQNIRLFQNMTVLENVLIGMDRTFRRTWVEMIFRLPTGTREEREQTARAMDLLEFMGLAGRAGNLAKNLPYGEQRKLEIARAMAANPKLLLLDEPAAGMNPKETADLMELIRRIRDRGITVLLIEHHMSLVMGISDRIAVLDYGVKIAEGTPEQVKNDPKVIEAYLGKEEVS